MNLFTKQSRLKDIENRRVVAKRVGEQRIGSLGSADGNYYI